MDIARIKSLAKQSHEPGAPTSDAIHSLLDIAAEAHDQGLNGGAVLSEFSAAGGNVKALIVYANARALSSKAPKVKAFVEHLVKALLNR